MSDAQSPLPIPTAHTGAAQIAAPLDAKATLLHYRPPYMLLSDMLFAAALAPAAPLQRQFPGAPFLIIGGRIPLSMWFSRIKGFHYRNEQGCEQDQGSDRTVIYNELTVVTFLRRRAFFVPGIYATSHLTILIGHHHYGMPKQPVQMSLHVEGSQLKSTVLDGKQQTSVRARWWGSGTWLAALPSHFWPWWSWPSIFPDGRTMQAEILETPRVHPAQVQGSLALAATWLPQPMALLPWGLYTPNLCMQLPSPGQ